MKKMVTQKEALEVAITTMRKLMESTRNKKAQDSIEQALMYMGQVRSHIQNEGIPEYDDILLMNTNGRYLTVSLIEGE